MPKYTVEDTQTGKRVTFEWNGSVPPTDNDFEEVFSSAGLRESQPTQTQEPVKEERQDPSMSEILEKGPITTAREMFQKDPSPSGSLNIANLPSRKIGGSIRSVIEKIPDPQSQSVLTNIALGIPETAGEIGADLAEAQTSVQGMALNAVPLAKFIRAVARKAPELMPAISQSFTGVPKFQFQSVMKEPSKILPKFLGGRPENAPLAGARLQRAKEAVFGKKNIKPSPAEVNDPQLSLARKTAKNVMDKVNEIKKQFPKREDQSVFFGDKNFGAEVLKAKRATDLQIKSNPKNMAELMQQKQELSGILDEFYPTIRKAEEIFSSVATRRDLTKILPVLKSGDPSIMRLALTIAGRGAGVPFGVTSPVVNATANAMVGLTLPVLRKLAASNVPRVAQLAAAELTRRKGAESGSN